MRSRHILSLASAAAAASLLSGAYVQADEGYKGALGSDYSTGTNWTGGSPPTGADQAYIGYGVTTPPGNGPAGTLATASTVYSTPGNITTTGRFTIGWKDTAAANGTLTMNGSAGTLQFGVTGGGDYVGVGGGTGLLEVDAGILSLQGSGASLNIGVNGASTGTVNVAGGTINCNGAISLGAGGGTSAALNITSGSVTSTGTVNTLGTISVSGSSTFNTPGQLDNGAVGAADNSSSYTQSGGIVTATNQFVIGAHGTTNSAGVSGGTLNTNSLFIGGYSDGAAGKTGTFSLSGNGIVNANQTNFNGGGQTSGIFNLNGGTLNTSIVQKNTGTGTGTFNFNGGILVATASTATFMQNLAAANVQTGGAIINTNAKNITIAQPLLGTTNDNGLTKQGAGTLALTGNNTYNGPLSITGGTVQVSGSGTLGIGTAQILNVGNAGDTAEVLDVEKVLSTTDVLRIFESTPVAEVNVGTSDVFTVNQLFINGVGQAAGTYTNISNPTIVSGPGQLIVTTSAPEPASLGLLGIAALGLLARRRRNA